MITISVKYRGGGYKVQHVGVYKVQQVRVYKVSLFFRVREVGVYKVHLFFILTWSHFFEQARICFFCGNPSLKGLAFFLNP